MVECTIFRLESGLIRFVYLFQLNHFSKCSPLKLNKDFELNYDDLLMELMISWSYHLLLYHSIELFASYLFWQAS